MRYESPQTENLIQNSNNITISVWAHINKDIINQISREWREAHTLQPSNPPNAWLIPSGHVPKRCRRKGRKSSLVEAICISQKKMPLKWHKKNASMSREKPGATLPLATYTGHATNAPVCFDFTF